MSQCHVVEDLNNNNKPRLSSLSLILGSPVGAVREGRSDGVTGRTFPPLAVMATKGGGGARLCGLAVHQCSLSVDPQHDYSRLATDAGEVLRLVPSGDRRGLVESVHRSCMVTDTVHHVRRYTYHVVARYG